MRSAAFYVEWTGEEEIETILELLRREEAEVWEIDGDVDLEYCPGPGIKRAHTVFRLRADREREILELLSAVAEHPAVRSVEKCDSLDEKHLIKCLRRV